MKYRSIWTSCYILVNKGLVSNMIIKFSYALLFLLHYENFIIGQSLHVVHNSLMGHFKAFHGPEVAHGPYVACSCVRPNWKIKLIKVNSKTLKNQAQIFKAFNLNQNFLVFGEFQEKQCQNPSKTETKQSKEVNVCGWVGNTLLKKLIWCLKNRCLVNSTDSMQLV